MPEREIDLTPFCTADAYRYNLDLPWGHDDWEYATDRRIIVRQPVLNTVCHAKRKVPDVAFLFKHFPECTKKWPGPLTTAFVTRCLRCGEDVGCLPPCTVAGRRLLGYYVQLVINVLSKGVRYCPNGKPEDPIAFTCGEVQGLLAPLGYE